MHIQKLCANSRQIYQRSWVFDEKSMADDTEKQHFSCGVWSECKFVTSFLLFLQMALFSSCCILKLTSKGPRSSFLYIPSPKFLSWVEVTQCVPFVSRAKKNPQTNNQGDVGYVARTISFMANGKAERRFL